MQRIWWMMFVGLLWATSAEANSFFNCATESCDTSGNSCTAHPTWVLCDDFEDGTWVTTGDNPSLAANDGWLGYAPGGNLGNPGFPAAGCSGIGAAGTTCAARTVLGPAGADGSDAANASAPFAPAIGGNPCGWGLCGTNYGHLWMRQYIKFQPGYQWCPSGCSQKFFSFIHNFDQAGIDQGGVGRDLRIMELCPVWSCNFENEGFLGQNQGNDITMTTGRWYYIEWEIQVNTYDVRDGIFRMWINDCGTTGVCTGSPTLRASYTNIGYIGGGSANWPTVGSFRTDYWGGPSDEGEIRFDQVVVATSGPIGFMGSSGGDVTPPAAPTGLHFCSGGC